MTTEAAFDVIRAEVFRRGLEAITSEMAVTLQRTSGSPVVTEGMDFSTSLLDTDVEQVAFSGYVAFHVSTSFLGVECVTQNYDRDDIRPGDGFLINDPYTAGAIHQGDVAVVMPYFYDGQLVAWGHVDEHVLDVGGSAVSGFAPEARDCFSEALRFPAVRAIRFGELDREWRRFIEKNVRVPEPVLNDITSMIAAHHTGQERLERLIDEYGVDGFRELCAVNKHLSEQMVRSKLARIPDGVFVSHDWVEYDGHGTADLLPLSCRLEIEGDQATFCFQGHEQIDAFVNATPAVMLGQSMTTLLCQLLYDVPVNSGIWKPFTFDLGPAGTIVNPLEPAPTTQGHMETGMRINKLVADVVSQAVALSDDEALRSRVAGQPSNGATSAALAGFDPRRNRPIVLFPMSPPHMQGGGGQTTNDGLDTYGAQCSLGNGVPAVEIEESTGPVMILWRRIRANSGGAGTYRGGQGAETALAIRGVPTLRGPAFSAVTEAPSRGAAGGLPAAASHYHVIRSSNLSDLFASGTMPSPDTLRGTFEQPPAKVGSMTVRDGDVFIFTGNGGGGVGDPLLREPDAVAFDVRNRYVTPEAAHTIYGVELDAAGGVDLAGTERRRAKLRQERIGEPPRAIASTTGVSGSVRRVAGEWTCGYCSERLGRATDNYRSATVVAEEDLAERHQRHDMHIRPRPDGMPRLVLRHHFCPACASAIVTDMTLAGAEMVAAPRRIRAD